MNSNRTVARQIQHRHHALWERAMLRRIRHALVRNTIYQHRAFLNPISQPVLDWKRVLDQFSLTYTPLSDEVRAQTGASGYIESPEMLTDHQIDAVKMAFSALGESKV